MIDFRIQGIPCKIKLVSAEYTKPDYNTWASDIDYYGGYEDILFEVYDRKGYPAKWLERKMTDQEIRKAEERLVNEQH